MSANKSLFIILNLTHECNLSCSYCYYSDELIKKPGRMSSGMIENLFQRVSESSFTDITFAFHGGEPLTISSDVYRQIFEIQKHYLKDKNVYNTFQTNGTLINEGNINVIKEFGARIGISLDGPEQVHNYYRKSKNGKGSFSKIIESIELLNDRELSYGILSVCSDITARSSNEIYPFFKSLKRIRLLDLLPAATNSPKKILSKMNYSKIVNEVFDEWFHDSEGFFEIRILKSIIIALIKNEPALCIFKNNCFKNGAYLSIDISGNVSPCDDMPSIVLGNITENPIDSFFESNTVRQKNIILENARVEKCNSCKWYKLCNSGCPSNSLEDKVNYYCDDYNSIFSHIYMTLVNAGVIVDDSVTSDSVERIPNPVLKNFLKEHIIPKEALLYK